MFELILKAQEILGLVSGASLALIALFAIIPGNQPEALLQKLVDLIAKISRK
jgi:hypothetical protein